MSKIAKGLDLCNLFLLLERDFFEAIENHGCFVAHLANVVLVRCHDHALRLRAEVALGRFLDDTHRVAHRAELRILAVWSLTGSEFE